MLFHLDHLAFCFIVIVIVCSVLSLILFVFFFFLNHLFMVSNMVCTHSLMYLYFYVVISAKISITSKGLLWRKRMQKLIHFPCNS